MPISCIWQFRELVSYIRLVSAAVILAPICRHNGDQKSRDLYLVRDIFL
jgi:hypothetical protein